MAQAGYFKQFLMSTVILSNTRIMKFLRFTQLALIALAFLSSCAYAPLKSRKLYSDASKKTYDVIVVPGVPFEDGEWSRLMKARVYWAKILMDNGIAKNVMFSGSSVYTPYFEADIMALYGEAIGIDPNHIYTETKAEHSTENIFYGYKKAKLLGFESVALATDPIQARSLQGFTKRSVSKDVDIIPIIFRKLKRIESEMKDPRIEYSTAFNEDFISITEREGLLKRLNGTRGKNVQNEAYDK